MKNGMAPGKMNASPRKARSWLLGTDPSAPETQMAEVFSTKRKKPGSRIWMRLVPSGQYEYLELDRSAIMRRASVSARDLRFLGPVFTDSSYILARERSMVVNLEFIKAVVTAEEMYLLNATSTDVSPFVDNLRQQFPLSKTSSVPGKDGKDYLAVSITEISKSDDPQCWHPYDEADEEVPSDDFPSEFPFEFRILECALDVICSYLAEGVSDLEETAYPILDEFVRNVTSSNLEQVRSLKTNLTRLTGRVQKVRDELEQLLNDDEDMAELYLTRKLAQDPTIASSVSHPANEGHLMPLAKSNRASNFHGATSLGPSVGLASNIDVLEMLLEVYFMDLDLTLNKLTTIREYTTDTEDYINIQLDHQRNQIFQFQILVTTTALAIGVGTGMLSACSMNINVPLYTNNHVFTPYVMVILGTCVSVICGVVTYFYWKGLFE